MPSEAELIRLWAARGVVLLQHHIAELNALNVFPVADADTGTNLYLTFQSAQAAELAREGDVHDAFDALMSLAKGAVSGARGNSGVILAEALIGAAEGLKQPQHRVSEMFTMAASRAREAVRQPQPGTILSVLDSIADLNSDDPKFIADHARVNLLNTRDLLPELKKAGVVDAGGRGLVILLDALVQVCEGVEKESSPVGFVPLQTLHADCVADRAYELIFKTTMLDMKEIQLRLQPYGTSISSTSDGVMVNVHIHTDVPKAVLSDIRHDADVWDVMIESLKPASAPLGVVAFTEGIGSVMHLVALGITAINDEGHLLTKDDVVQAVLKTNQPNVLVLMHPKYDALADGARSALQKFDVAVTFVQSTSIVSTLAAVSVFDPGNSVEKNREAMSKASIDIVSLDLHGQDFQTLTTQQLRDVELITIVWGVSADSSYQTALLNYVKENAPTATINEVCGDQTRSIVQVGLE